MNFATGGFWHRFSTALTTATIFVAAFYVFFFTAVPHGDFASAFALLGLFQTIEVGAILAIAWPVENFIAKRNIKTIYAGLIYVAIGAGVLALSMLATFGHWFANPYVSAFIAAGTFYATPIAFAARLLYPVMLTYKKVSSWVGLVVLVLSVVAAVSYSVAFLRS